MKKINWGIIGLGIVADEFASAFDKVENSKLKAIASKNIKKLDYFKNKYKILEEYCFSKYEDLIKNKDIDIIYIALPHNFHFEWSKYIINNNKNLLVEKPATINSLEINNLNELLKTKQIFFAEGFMYRYHPQTKKIINIIQAGEIGELQSMSSFFGESILKKKKFLWITKYKFNEKNRLYNKNLGGGCILDLGCYPVSMSTLIAGTQNEKIDFNKIKFKNKKIEYLKNNIDFDSYLDIEFEGNFRSSIGCSFNKNLGKKTTIYGSKGSITISNTWHCKPAEIELNGKVLNLSNNLYPNLFSYEIENISECLIASKLMPDFPAVNIADTILNMKIIDKWQS